VLFMKTRLSISLRSSAGRRSNSELNWFCCDLDNAYQCEVSRPLLEGDVLLLLIGAYGRIGADVHRVSYLAEGELSRCARFR
jgi:hypothetical protein